MGLKSTIWQYFTEATGGYDCNIDGCTSKFVKRSKNFSTTGLWGHLKTHHKSTHYDPLEKDKLPSKRKTEDNPDGPSTFKRRLSIDAETEIIEMLARTNSPFTLADDPLFKKMSSAAFPGFKPHGSRHYALNILPRVANDVMARLRGEIADRCFVITTDGWSAINKPSPSLYR
jgi:hypothetical protein